MIEDPHFPLKKQREHSTMFNKYYSDRLYFSTKFILFTVSGVQYLLLCLSGSRCKQTNMEIKNSLVYTHCKTSEPRARLQRVNSPVKGISVSCLALDLLREVRFDCIFLIPVYNTDLYIEVCTI